MNGSIQPLILLVLSVSRLVGGLEPPLPVSLVANRQSVVSTVSVCLLYPDVTAVSLCRQMVGKMGGEAMSHLNSSSGSVEPSLYYPGQKRPGEDGGKNKLGGTFNTLCLT